ncbi:MAG: thioesterase, partial [Proteobacteria bacterium]|nr:thioesterase [Pseudomonadota bacterium]
FVGSSSIDYKNELFRGDPLRMETVLLDFDERRIHVFQKMYHAGKGYLAAEAEFLFLHVSLKNRNITDIPLFSMSKLAEVRQAHECVGIHKFVGRTIGLR